MSVWITRSSPDNLATARRLRSAGLHPLLFPVIETRALAAPLMGVRPDALVFSSIHAVRHHLAEPELLDVPVFVRNEEIAEAARGAGYLSITSTSDDESLLASLVRYAVPAAGTIGYYCAERTSTAVERALLPEHGRIERRNVYRSQPIGEERMRELVERLPRVGSIVLHSSLCSETVREAVQRANWRGDLWCISEQSARGFADLSGVRTRIARHTTETALLDMICSRDWRGRRKSDVVLMTRQFDRNANDNESGWDEFH
jgi:uroporphyrinogen-III synthase